jgi:hypothetical protein
MLHADDGTTLGMLLTWLRPARNGKDELQGYIHSIWTGCTTRSVSETPGGAGWKGFGVVRTQGASIQCTERQHHLQAMERATIAAQSQCGHAGGESLDPSTRPGHPTRAPDSIIPHSSTTHRAS